MISRKLSFILIGGGVLMLKTVLARRSSANRRSTTSIYWQPHEFPAPDSEGCKSSSARLCDPDAILLKTEKEAITARIAELEKTLSVPCSGNADNEELVEVAVVVVAHMDRASLSYNNEESARIFATHLHNKWGVGKQACPNGVLIFLSLGDRAMYFSRGAAMEPILTDRRLDAIMESMKSFLRNERYGAAIEEALQSLHDYIEMGAPSRMRRFIEETLFPLSFLGLFVGVLYWGWRQQQREQREYAQVRSQLNQIDRDRAEALQGRYNCTSCPICLEPFQEVPMTTASPTADNTNDTATGSDNNGPDTTQSDTGTTDTSESPLSRKVGSDGLPLKLLRCGHVFDETCWNEWITSGQGNVRRCPICQQDVGNTENAATSNPPNSATVRRNRHHDRMEEDRVYRQFHRERNFRLARLGVRYPRYIRPDMIQRWSRSTYDGSLSRDSTFTRSNPSLRNNNRGGHSRSSGGYSSFGGGSSSGGRGGSW